MDGALYLTRTGQSRTNLRRAENKMHEFINFQSSQTSAFANAHRLRRRISLQAGTVKTEKETPTAHDDGTPFPRPYLSHFENCQPLLLVHVLQNFSATRGFNFFCTAEFCTADPKLNTGTDAWAEPSLPRRHLAVAQSMVDMLS